jgi:hypothetical protein
VFNADALDVSDRTHPGQHLPIPLTGRGKASASPNAIVLVDDSRDVQILLGTATYCPGTGC